MKKLRRSHNPPVIAENILKRLFPDGNEHTPLGDFEEVYFVIRNEKSALKADLWYWMQLLLSMKSYIAGIILWNMLMFNNYLKTALRNFYKQKTLSFINIFGLSVGLACSILITLYMKHEISYDKFHKNADNIFRITTEYTKSSFKIPKTPFAMGPALKNEFPEVVYSVRIIESFPFVSYEDKSFNEKKCFYADNEIFKMFTFPLSKGNQETALKDPNTVVLTKKISIKYFGEDDPIGKILKIKNSDHKVTGVLEEIPGNSHLQFEILISYATIDRGARDDGHRNSNDYTYILLSENCSVQNFEKNLEIYKNKYLDGELLQFRKYYLQPLKEIHLNSDFEFGLASQGNYNRIYLLSGIAFFILLIACINFINLSIGSSSVRIKEIGIRKVMGAVRSQLIRQFWGEVFLLTFFALISGLILARLSLSAFNTLAGRDISFYFNLSTLGLIAGLLLISGIIAGCVPALLLSSLKPAEIFGGKLKISDSGIFSKILIMIQFSLSIIFIISTIVINGQINYVKSRHNFLNGENVITIPLYSLYSVYKNNEKRNKVIETFKSNISNYGSIISASRSSYYCGYGGSTYGDNFEINGNKFYAEVYMTGYGYLKTFGLDLTEGRNFSSDFETDRKESILINETFAKELGWENPVGEKLQFKGHHMKRNPTIIGIVKDFHFEPLFLKIRPLILTIEPFLSNYFSIRIKADNLSDSIALIKTEWNKIFPEIPFDYTFLQDDMAELYNKEDKMGKIFGYS